jgi:peptidoglycan biosynthesis protein MviN/MurJ (putative lipid II flippase)
MLALAWEAGGPVLFALLALSVFVWHSAGSVVSLVFQRGSFDVVSHQQTADALRITICAAVPIAFYNLALRALMSQGRSGQVAAVGAVIAVMGLTTLSVAWGLRSLPVAQAHWAIANSCGAVLAWGLLMQGSAVPRGQVWRMVRSAVLAAVVVLLPLWLMPSLTDGTTSWWALAFRLMGEGIAYAGMSTALALLFGLLSMRELKRFLAGPKRYVEDAVS